MCGGDLEVNESLSIGICKFCGSKNSLPSKTDEIKANLYNRANDLRRNNEFDRAAIVYETILNQDSTEAEAYWGLVLCKYGIEYVEDLNTHKMVPTCHRTQKGSILADTDFKLAMKLAEPEAEIVYENEAKTIESIQKQILALSMKEDPFDVFISYKEKDETGKRTKDSIRAQELYDLLTKEGFKVFFSRITLEDKLGEAWEPTIFAALNSARVMVVIGSKRENFYSPWVKNEWGRYLKFIKQGEEKMLIPAFFEMDAYDLPDEFSHLQAQDMTKLGFMQDLVRGIKKILGESDSSESNQISTYLSYGNVSIGSLLERAFLCLEIGDFTKGEDLLEQVLNIDPKNSKAYIGKLMVDLEITNESLLSESVELLEDYDNFQLAIRFSDEEYKKTLEGYNLSIIERLEDERKENLYQEALKKKENSWKTEDFQDAANIFTQIKGYKDSDYLAEECLILSNEILYDNALFKMKHGGNEDVYYAAAQDFEKLKGYKDADCLRNECETLAKESIYKHGRNMMRVSYNESSYQEASKIFEKISGYKDSDKLFNECIALAEKERRKISEKPIIVIGIIGIIIIIILFLTILK
jgi:hypothetical protein